MPCQPIDHYHQNLENKRIFEQCTIRKPLHVSIPDEGIVVACPVHPKGHLLTSPKIWMNAE
jgi:hypothetical protein